MTGFRYIAISLFLAGVAAFIALDFNALDFGWMTLLSFENMCTDPELREYVFYPFSCDAYNQIGVVDFGGDATFNSPERLHELNRPEKIVHID